MPVSVWNLKVLTERGYFILNEISSLNGPHAALHVFTRLRNVPEEPSKGIGTVVISASDCPWWGATLWAFSSTTAPLHLKEDPQLPWVCVRSTDTLGAGEGGAIPPLDPKAKILKNITESSTLMPLFFHLRALVFINVEWPKPVVFLQPLNVEQMLEIQGFSSTARYHLKVDMLYSSFLLLFHLPSLLVSTVERLAQKLCMSYNDSHC